MLPKLKPVPMTIGIVAVVALLLLAVMVFMMRFFTTTQYMRNLSFERHQSEIASEQANISDNSTAKVSPSSASVKPIQKTALKIIKTATIRFQVKNVSQSLEAIKGLVEKSGGYLASEDLQNSSDQIQNTLVIRVPVDRFDALLQGLDGQAVYVDSKNIQVQDVTAEFIDTEARLKAKRDVELRYLAILKQAQTVKDILEVEGQLGVIRVEIETVEGKLKYLNDQISYSTINLTIYQPIRQTASPEQSFWKQVGDGLFGGWKGMLALLVGLTYLWPLWIAAIAGVWFWRSRANKKQA